MHNVIHLYFKSMHQTLPCINTYPNLVLGNRLSQTDAKLHAELATAALAGKHVHSANCAKLMKLFLSRYKKRWLFPRYWTSRSISFFNFDEIPPRATSFFQLTMQICLFLLGWLRWQAVESRSQNGVTSIERRDKLPAAVISSIGENLLSLINMGVVTSAVGGLINKVIADRC